MNISISENANNNYLAKVVKLNQIQKHSNADRLQVASVDFQDVITGLDAKKGDLYVYFPVESAIDSGYLSWSNSFRDKDLNADSEATGFFEKNCRVRAVKLRGEKSMGYIIPITDLHAYFKDAIDLSDYVDESFDTIGDTLLVKKYFVPKPIQNNARQGTKPRISRMIEGQIHLHVDTDNLRRSADRIKPDDNISISYKVHGTSFWVANAPVLRKQSLFERFIGKLGINISKEEYDFVYGSRRVVKNEYETQETRDYYGGDLWENIKEELKDFIPKNYTFYGECVGFTKEGAGIQSPFDYGCAPATYKLMIYRIVFTNADGMVHNLSTSEMAFLAAKLGFATVPIIYTGPAKDWNPRIKVTEDWTEKFIKSLEKKYNEKDCYLSVNKVPEEGIVVRKERFEEFEAYKLKSFSFLEYETKALDSGTVDMEE